ncbi:hypothetical protein [Methanothermobacter sp.]|uniref:hypothetical protein n=1 Tax=Methanothermobacter sp. TaxID=1884223 RepID=UPI0026110C14|nr:hypothetical protein [Methanothermobacter sp.]MDI9614323.1 hypothetical protein [Methanothermobacter sp.]
MDNNILKEFLRDKELKNQEFLVGIIVNIILLYIVNSVMNWNLSFVEESFRELIPLFNVVIAANLIANAALIIYRKQWLWTFAQIILSALGYLLVSSLYSVFPFTFRNIYVFYSVKSGLLVAMVVMAVAVFLHGLKFVLKFILKVEP